MFTARYVLSPYTTQIHFVFKNLIQSTVRPKYAVAAAGVMVTILHTSDYNAHNVTSVHSDNVQSKMLTIKIYEYMASYTLLL